MSNSARQQSIWYKLHIDLPLLLGLLSRSEGARTMVFVNTKAFVERVARALASLRTKRLSNPWKKHDNIPL